MFGHDSLGINMIAKSRTFSPFRNNSGFDHNPFVNLCNFAYVFESFNKL